MAIPQQQYMKLKGGENASTTDIYTSNRIKVGDTLKISGTASNNGIFTVSSIILNETGGSDDDVYYVLKGRAIVSESSDTSRDLRIEVIRATGDKLCAMADAAGSGNIDVWSTNNTTSPGTRGNGWTIDAITPTLSGLPAKYIYFFVDEALRSCNINEECESSIKWFGFIQRDQFANSNDSSLSPIFSEWQQHPNTLSPPLSSAGLTYAYAGTDFTENKSGGGNYYNSSNNGVARAKEANEDADLSGDTEDVKLKTAVSDLAATGFTFENNNDTKDILDQSFTGEVITIGTAFGVAPNEYLTCKTPSTGSDITYQRAYGGSLTGTAPIAYAEHATPIINRGIGWNISVANGSSDGDWLPDVYEFHQTFIYDGNQESLPIRMGTGASSNVAFTHTASGGKSLRVAVFADVAYEGRVSGGRIYIRRYESDDELTLLLDIDIVQGVRSSLTGAFKTWVYSSNGIGFEVIPDAVGNCKEPNIDTYTTINGFSSQTKFISIGKQNEMYKDVVVANRRAFIVNVRTSGYTGELEKYGDRLMYSEINRFDTFLESNFIDVSKGDYGEYVAIKTFADRLLAYKHNLVHIINIASPNPANWYLEDTVRYAGVNYKYSVTNTKYGVAWVSDNGCYLYDGEKITNLIERKLGVNKVSWQTTNDSTPVEWAEFVNGSANIKDAMIGYEPMSDSLVIVRSPSDSTTSSEYGYVYDFNSAGWTFKRFLLTADSTQVTNFFQDWNNNLCISEHVGTNQTNIKKYLNVPTARSVQSIITRDIDFGDPTTIKKIYKVIFSYKSSVDQAIPLRYRKNGELSSNAFDTETLSETIDGNSNMNYNIGTFTPSSPISIGSISFEFTLPNIGIFEINEITIEYRIIRQKTLT